MDLLQKNENPIQVRLKFSIRNTIKSFRYSISFYLKEENFQFKTEEVKSKEDNSLIEFKKHLCYDYYFYKIQEIKITVTKLKLGKDNILKNYFIEENNPLSLSTIISSKNGIFQVAIEKSNNPYNKDNLKEILMIKMENNIDNNKNIILNKNNSFIDYIISGIQFKCFIGIDYSDKKYQNMNESKNDYLLSIKGFRETLYYFVRNFEVYAFDYILNDEDKNKNNNEIFLKLNKDNEEFGYTAIKYAYYEFLSKLNLSDDIKREEKKNKLSSLIYHLINQIYQEKNLNNYNIIFLLINSFTEKQFQDCIDCFTKSFLLPISFVIIGIGEDENKFEYLKKLCEINKGKDGEKKFRDNTFFISMKECEYNSDIIKNKCLRKIPEQIIEFYELNKISLAEIKKNNVNNKSSLRIFETYNSLISQMNSKEKEKDKDINKINNAAPSLNEIKINNNNKEVNNSKKEIDNEETPDGENNIDKNIDLNQNIDIKNNIKQNSLKAKHSEKNEKKFKLRNSSLKFSNGSKLKDFENPY